MIICNYIPEVDVGLRIEVGVEGRGESSGTVRDLDLMKVKQE